MLSEDALAANWGQGTTRDFHLANGVLQVSIYGESLIVTDMANWPWLFQKKSKTNIQNPY